jgi:hypothetical protein
MYSHIFKISHRIIFLTFHYCSRILYDTDPEDSFILFNENICSGSISYCRTSFVRIDIDVSRVMSKMTENAELLEKVSLHSMNVSCPHDRMLKV